MFALIIPPYPGAKPGYCPPAAPKRVTVSDVTPLGTVKFCALPVQEKLRGEAKTEGADVCTKLGPMVGIGVGANVGTGVGERVGETVGECVVGIAVGVTVGAQVGITDGAVVGILGMTVGITVGTGDTVAVILAVPLPWLTPLAKEYITY